MKQRERGTLLSELQGILTADLDLNLRAAQTQNDVNLEETSTSLLSIANDLPIVYTAFDGDHQQLVGYMRNFVLRCGKVPANPESILGYKDTVMARSTKRGVLLDDLAVLRGCDELWVFTDVPCEPAAVRDLAEGVVVELLYFLKRREGPTVKFVTLRELLIGLDPSVYTYEFGYEESVAELEESQKGAILQLSNSRHQVDLVLPPIMYHIIDPLDFKYAHWLRPRAYETGAVPLVPGLAIDLLDIPASPDSLGRIMVAWASLSRLATHALVFPSLDSFRQPSTSSAIFEKLWVSLKGTQTLNYGAWRDYSIPKAQQRCAWPLTEKGQSVLNNLER